MEVLDRIQVLQETYMLEGQTHQELLEIINLELQDMLLGQTQTIQLQIDY
jgi:hypothetical protein